MLAACPWSEALACAEVDAILLAVRKRLVAVCHGELDEIKQSYVVLKIY